MSYTVNDVDGDDLVAFVRLTEGGTVKLNTGDTVPPEADLNHVAALVERGVLSADEGTKPNSVDAILSAVGDDPELAQKYLDEENASARPRTTLVAALEAVLTAAGSDED